MRIDFENGSAIKSINTKEQPKRSSSKTFTICNSCKLNNICNEVGKKRLLCRKYIPRIVKSNIEFIEKEAVNEDRI